MAAADKGIYDPTGSFRSDVGAEKLDGGIGLGDEKNPTPTLRLFGTNLGNQWLNYGSMGGGTQNYLPSPQGSNIPAGCKWFLFFYTGLMVIGEDAVFGNWRVRVEGDGLEPVAYQVGKHTKTMLMVGEKTKGMNPISIRSITIEPYKPVRQPGMDDDDGFTPVC